MAIVISSRSKVVTGVIVTCFGLILMLIIGSAVGWFDSTPEVALPVPHRHLQLTNYKRTDNQVINISFIIDLFVVVLIDVV